MFIGSSSFLQATRTCITAWMGLNFNQIRPLTRELPALVLLIGSYSFLQEDNHKVSHELEFRPDPIMDCGVRCP